MEQSVTPSSTAQLAQGLVHSPAARRTLAVACGSLFIAACAHISVPLFFTPVPMTLQPFAVLLVGLLLGPALGAATCAAYLLEGAVGLPVFTPQGPGGLLQLLGPTGGYLLSYPAAAAIAGAVWRRVGRRGLGSALLGAGAANLLILLAGACWLMTLKHLSLTVIAHVAVLPFLGGDAIKVVLAALLAAGWQRARFDRAHSPAEA